MISAPALVLLVALASALALSAPAAARHLLTEQVIASWATPARHPLTAKILDTRTGRIIDAMPIATGILVGTPVTDAIGIAAADLILLGEVHDNPHHHLLRAGLIHDLTMPGAFGRMAFPAIVTEHLDADQADAALTARKRAIDEPGPAAVDAFFEAVAWSRSGWPPANIFRPLYDLVLDARLPLLAGDASRARIRDLARGNPAAISDAERTRLDLSVPLEPPLQQALLEELQASHCGLMPATAFGGMAFAQVYRDAHLADALIKAAREHGRAILLAGNGHVRADRGVPWHLARRASGLRRVTLLLIEVADGRSDPMSYVPRGPEGRPATDLVIFTPRTEREDPCERMRAMMKKRE